MAPEDVTIGEISRRLNRIEERIDVRFDAVDHRLESLQFVRNDTYTVQMNALSSRVEALEESKTWFGRGLVAAIVFPVVSALIIAQVIIQ